ncbi:MAG: sialate O-acetylesterase [Pirellulales bacterium]|nr:sialate O-acetylesterase [Pirellulales bacterium]
MSLLSIAALASTARADVRLPAVIGDHMVLQRDAPLPIWGWADPGEEVTVTLGDAKSTAKADAAGKWRVTLPAIKSGKGLEMSVAGKNTIKLADILVGEVWLGSGQSNMQWSVQLSSDAEKEIAAANYPEIRLFTVPMVPSGRPAENVNAQWVVCTPETIKNFSGVLFFFGRELHKELQVPLGLINTSWGGTRIEPWTPPEGLASQTELQGDLAWVKARQADYQAALDASLAQYRAWIAKAEKAKAAGGEIPDPPAAPDHPLNSNGTATGLYNGMIHPLVPLAMRGALWYQGEANVGEAMHYHTRMKALIQGWRTVWGQGDFPFLFVQLAPFDYGGVPTRLPELWEAQAATLTVPNTGMAVTTDLVANLKDIHPPNKQDVGKRLALWALANTYHHSDVEFSGPVYESQAVEGSSIRLKFKHAASGLTSRDSKPLSWFSIAAADKKFVPAEATIDGDSVVVRSPDVKNPVAVRFGWHQLAEPNLVNKAGLPPSPFRTDTWSDATAAAPAGG